MGPGHCYCWGGRANWPIRSDDLYCGRCGCRLIDLEPGGPCLDGVPTPTLLAYLRPEPGGGLAGLLTFTLRGLHGIRPRVEWAHTAGPLFALASLAHHGVNGLEVRLHAGGPTTGA